LFTSQLGLCWSYAAHIVPVALFYSDIYTAARIDNKRLFGNWEVQRGEASLAGVWGCPPASKVPQEWGIEGVEKGFINNLNSGDFVYRCGIISVQGGRYGTGI